MTALRNAYARLTRADEHIADLKALHLEVCTAQAKATVVKYNPTIMIPPGEARQVIEFDNTRHPPVPARIALLAGDAADNLRAALNYLVGKLAVLDSGVRGRRNQFPIEPLPKNFQMNTKGARGFLCGVNTAHSAVIEGLQPYNGCKWTRALGEISNYNKHNDLVVVTHDQMISFIMTTDDPGEGLVTTAAMQVQIQPVLRIAMGNGMPLIEIIETIRYQVADLLDTFNSEFERESPSF